jgi:hypothetical protein
MVIAEKLRCKAFVGSSHQDTERLENLAKSLELDELAVATWNNDPRCDLSSLAVPERQAACRDLADLIVQPTCRAARYASIPQ